MNFEFTIDQLLKTSGLNSIIVPRKNTAVFVIDYPINIPYNLKIYGGEFGKDVLYTLKHIALAYKHIYKNPDKYIIWGH